MKKMPMQVPMFLAAVVLSVAGSPARAQTAKPTEEKNAIEELAKLGVEARRYYLDELHKYVTEDDKDLEKQIAAIKADPKKMCEFQCKLPTHSKLRIALNSQSQWEKQLAIV